jgi:hypothetical protein
VNLKKEAVKRMCEVWENIQDGLARR